jgi:UDP-4-amino-4,6-dideoxy-N-acetyl-beta-L-altrosamine transaminase
MIPYGRHNINESDINAVIDVLKSDHLTQGPMVNVFEQKISTHVGAKYACATNSATSALHLACLALGVEQGDNVWTSPITFVASANCALYCQANIDFVDIDIKNGNISISALREKLIYAEKNNSLPKVVIAVHLAGQSCDMEQIKELSKHYGFKVIEDASHAIGARFKQSYVGCGKYSDITIFSFHPVKIITSAEGGLAVTNCSHLVKRMKLLRSHGITAEDDELTEESHGPWYYQQQHLGFNYRMSDLHAALGISQLTRLDEFIKKRNELALRYDEAFINTKITPLITDDYNYSTYHLYVVLLPLISTSEQKQFHKNVITKLRKNDITAHVHYIPVHIQPFYKNLGFKTGDFPIAEEYYSRAVTIPLYPDLTFEEQDYIIKQLLNLI